MGGSSKTETTNQTRNPWEPAQPGLNDILSKAQQYGNDASMWTPTYSANTTGGVTALGQLGQSASFGGDTTRAVVGQTTQGGQVGQNQLQKTANGDYLNANSYLDPVIQRSLEDTANMVNSQFSGMGRYGSAAQTDALTRQLGGIEMNARLQNYGAERGYQNQAANTLQSASLQGAQIAPNADAADAQRVAQQMAAGQYQDQMDAAIRQAPIQATNWQAGITDPIAALGGTMNGTTTTSQSPNIASMLLGGAMMAGGAMTGSPGMAMSGLGQLGGGMSGNSLGTMTQPSSLPWLQNYAVPTSNGFGRLSSGGL